MADDLIARSSIIINVPIAKVWDALVNPTIIKRYMFGTEVVSDWKEGNPILWKGVWKEKPYEDKGVILKIVPEQTLRYTHFSPQDRKSTRLNSSHPRLSRMPSSA